MGACGLDIGNGLVGSDWKDFFHLKDLYDRINKWVDRGLCLYYANECRKSVEANVDEDNINQDPNKCLIDAIQCQQEGRSDCSSCGWIKIQRSGIQQDPNCQKAAECALNLTQPQ
jgi:hypothetical protein